MLEQCCNHSKQCRNNVATLCCAKNRRCESSPLVSPVDPVYMGPEKIFEQTNFLPVQPVEAVKAVEAVKILPASALEWLSLSN